MKPLKAVRKKCLWCMNEQPKEVKLCPTEDCELWPFRFGKNPNKNRTLKLKDIKQYCLVCSSHRPKQVKECWDKDCVLFPFKLIFSRDEVDFWIESNSNKTVKKEASQISNQIWTDILDKNG